MKHVKMFLITGRVIQQNKIVTDSSWLWLLMQGRRIGSAALHLELVRYPRYDLRNN